MGLTEEKLRIKINLDVKYKFNGKSLDFRDLEILEANIKEALLDQLFNTVDSNISMEAEDLDEVSNDFNIEFIEDY